jgi:ribA/ribD-fused uncharacterized protein
MSKEPTDMPSAGKAAPRPDRTRPRRPHVPERMLIRRGILLNFWLTPFWLPHPITDELFCYPGGEWWFQAYKALFVQGLTTEMRVRLHDKIASCRTGRAAKQAGSALSPFSVAKWNHHSYNVMIRGQLAKYTQHERARIALKNTGDAILIEHRPDPVWGDNLDGTGRNQLGKILMEVRGVL